MSVSFSVLLPTYNERENIALVIWLIKRAFDSGSGHTFEIIVIDDNSPDGTQDVVRKLQTCFGIDQVVLVTRPEKRGLGSAYRDGLLTSRGKFVILMDADLSHHPKYIADFIRMQEQTNCDIVTGSRYMNGGGVYGWNFKRKLTSRGANVLAATILQQEVSDLTGSFRLFKKECLVPLIQETKSAGYAFQMEIIVRAKHRGLKICQVPIVFVDRLFGESKLGKKEIVLYLSGLVHLFFTI